jgi:hypothetical protein
MRDVDPDARTCIPHSDPAPQTPRPIKEPPKDQPPDPVKDPPKDYPPAKGSCAIPAGPCPAGG